MPDIQEHETIWFPGIYGGRTGEEWTQTVKSLPDFPALVSLVQRRAQEDGTWCIETGKVGENNENEDKMRLMMKFVSSELNIGQCLDHILEEGMGNVRTVDWLCRELANASKYMIP
jgi:hypothetical protein